MTHFFDGLAKHKGAFYVGLIALLALGALGSYVVNQKDAKNEEGKNALFQAEKTYETELKALAGVKAPASTPPPADPKAAKAKREEEAASNKKLEETSYQKFDVDSKLPQTVKKYQAVIQQYGSTRAAFEARMTLGSLYYAHGEPTKAVPVLQAAAEVAPAGNEKALAFSALGYAQENSAKPAEALQAYEKALNLGNDGIKGDLLLAIARNHEALHDSAKARSTYDRILSELPNTDASKSAESFKARLE